MNIYPYVTMDLKKKSRIYSEVLSLIAMIILVCLNYCNSAWPDDILQSLSYFVNVKCSPSFIQLLACPWLDNSYNEPQSSAVFLG